jgi:hypothetical protein
MAAARPTGPRPVISSRVLPGQLQPQQPLIGGAEAAGDQRSVDVAERLGQQDASRFFGQEVVGVAAVTLPAVRRPVRRGTADHVAVPALLTHPAAGDVIAHHAVTDAEPLAALPDSNDLPVRLVPGDHPLVRLRPRTEVLPVDRAMSLPQIEDAFIFTST